MSRARSFALPRTVSVFALALAPALAVAVAVTAAAAATLAADPAVEDGVIEVQKTTITLAADGTVTRDEELAVRPFGPWAVGRFFDPSIDWDDARSTATVRRARTVTPSGRTVEAQRNALVPNTSSALERAVPYARMRQMTVAHVGVETGALTELAYTIADRAPSGVPLWGVAYLDAPLPVTEQALVLRVPAGTAVRHAATCPALVAKAEAGAIVYARRGVPAFNLAEAGGPHAGPCRVAWSAARDWAEVRAFLEGRVRPATEPTAALKERAVKLAPPGLPDEERIGKLHAFVVDGVETVRWPLASFDYAVRPAGAVLDSSIGHPLDKAVLLAALLRAAGYDAQVALAAADARPLPDVPSPALLEEAWVRVAGEPEWLDPAAPLDRRSRAHLAGRAVLPLDGAASAPSTLPELTPAQNRAALRLELALADKGDSLAVSGTEDLDLAGLYNAAAVFDRADERLAKALAAPLAGFGKAKAGAPTVARKDGRASSLRAAVTDGAVPRPRDGRPVRLLVPRVPGALAAETLQLQRGRRSLPLWLPAAAQERVELSLELPDGAELLFAPAPLRLENGAGSLVREVTRDGRKLTVTTTLTLPRREIAPADYAGLRALFAALDGEAGRTVLVAPAP